MIWVPGRADVDADRHQRDMVLHPDRVVLEPLVGVELEMIVVVIGVAVVLVHEILAEQMVGERMALLGFLASAILRSLPARRRSAALAPGLARPFATDRNAA